MLRRLSKLDWVTAAPYFLFVAILLPYVHFHQMWDGMWYRDCIFHASTAPWTLANFNCFDHVTFVYIFLVAIPQFFSHFNVVLLNLTMLAFGLISILCFQRITEGLWPGKQTLHIRSLLTLLFAVHPVVLANTINVTADPGVLLFFLMLLAGLVHKNTLVIILSSIALIFTKEVGIGLYLVTIFLYGVLFILLTKAPRTHRWNLFQEAGILGIPFLFFSAYFFIQSAADPTHLHWGEVPLDVFGQSFSTLHVGDQRFKIALAVIFVLNFTWIQLCFLFVACGALLDRASSWRPPRQWDTYTRWMLFLASLTLFMTFSLTRIFYFMLPRYMIILYPLGLLLAGAAIFFLLRSLLARTLTLCLLFALELSSVHRTWDPVSLHIFGSFPFGQHRLLPLAKSGLDSCCGFARDQMIYNLEYTLLDRLQQQIYAAYHIQPHTVIVMNENAWFGFGESIDPVTYGRSLAPSAFRPTYITATDLLKRRSPHPPSILYIQYPNLDNQKDATALRALYNIVEERDFTQDGYAIHVMVMALR